MTFPQLLDITVTIDGDDVTALVDPSSLQISNVLSDQVDTLTVTLVTTDPNLAPADWQEVIVTDASAGRLFGGFITSITETDGPDLGRAFDISASDYSIRLNRVIVKAEYEGETDKAILEDLFTAYLGGEGYDAATYTQAIKTHERLRVNRRTLLEVVQYLAELGQAGWYIDYERRLHFFPLVAAESDAPFGLSDTPDMTDTYPYSGIGVDRDGSGVVNRVEVVGGNYLSADATFYLAGTGQDKRVILPFRMRPPTGSTAIKVWRNDGSLASPSWTALTVKPGYIDTLTGANQVLYYYAEKVLEQQNNWPNLANAVKVEAKYEVPLRTRVRDQASYDFYGLYLDDTIIDESITDKATARLAALAMLAESAFAKTAIQLKTRQPGLRAGQSVGLKSSIYGLDGRYLIHKVVTRAGVNGRAEFTVGIGTYNPDLVDMLMRLARSAKPRAPWSEDEVLDEVLQLSEGLPVAEATPAPATSTCPYYITAPGDPDEGYIPLLAICP